jgi:hypothetical protein
MTALAMQAKLDKEGYPPITALLTDDGYRVWEEATIHGGEEGTLITDHVVSKWEGARVNALAVAAKPGRADVGLAQAAAYSAGFDRVCFGDAAAHLDVEALARAVTSVGPSSEIIPPECRHNGFQGSYSDVLRRSSPAEDHLALDEVLSLARTLTAPRVRPYIEIQQALWPHGTSLTDTEARPDFEPALTRVRAVQSILAKRL